MAKFLLLLSNALTLYDFTVAREFVTKVIYVFFCSGCYCIYIMPIERFRAIMEHAVPLRPNFFAMAVKTTAKRPVISIGWKGKQWNEVMVKVDKGQSVLPCTFI